MGFEPTTTEFRSLFRRPNRLSYQDICSAGSQICIYIYIYYIHIYIIYVCNIYIYIYIYVLYVEKQVVIMKDIYYKKTDTHQHLNPNLCHPKSQIMSISIGVADRIRRNCSDNV